MDREALFLLPLLVAIAIGWWLGRRQTLSALSSGGEPSAGTPHPEYFLGLDHLLNERTDAAIESFIRALEINSDTIPAHLALARLLRRKGDVERAIRVHQTLLARSGLSHADFLQIQLALARDYEAIGLLDRAENLLIEILRDKPGDPLRLEAQSLLVRLYEKEGEWALALEQGRKLLARAERSMEPVLAHYCCELADAALARCRPQEAEQHLQEALRLDPKSVRGSLLTAQLAMQREQWPQAIKALRRVAQQNPLFVGETIALLNQCFRRLERPDQYESYLDQCMVRSPSTTVMLARAEAVRRRQGVVAAGCFIADELKQRPSIRGFNRLLELYLEHGSPSTRESLTILRGLTEQLERSKPKYRCAHCGYAARILHWHCPSCREWGTGQPVYGLEGE